MLFMFLGTVFNAKYKDSIPSGYSGDDNESIEAALYKG